MSDARPIELCKRVVAELSAATFETKPATIERVYVPTAKTEDIGRLKVLVAASGYRMVPDNREEWEYQIDIDVGVIHRTALNTGIEAIAAFDKAMRITEQIADMYRFMRTGPEKDFRIHTVAFGAGGDQPYLQEFITDFNQFTSVVRLTFLQLRGE